MFNAVNAEGKQMNQQNAYSSFHIFSQDGYYLTERQTWTAKRELRALFSYPQAVQQREEARKWNPSARIIAES